MSRHNIPNALPAMVLGLLVVVAITTFAVLPLDDTHEEPTPEITVEQTAPNTVELTNPTDQMINATTTTGSWNYTVNLAPNSETVAPANGSHEITIHQENVTLQEAGQ